MILIIDLTDPIKDDTCYTETGHNFQGQGYTEKCVPWTITALEQNLLFDFPQQVYADY